MNLILKGNDSSDSDSGPDFEPDPDLCSNPEKEPDEVFVFEVFMHRPPTPGVPPEQHPGQHPCQHPGPFPPEPLSGPPPGPAPPEAQGNGHVELQEDYILKLMALHVKYFQKALQALIEDFGRLCNELMAKTLEEGSVVCEYPNRYETYKRYLSEKLGETKKQAKKDMYSQSFSKGIF
eukprot:Nk52_evm3s391 gene=Nk52_evmTU3s391